MANAEFVSLVLTRLNQYRDLMDAWIEVVTECESLPPLDDIQNVKRVRAAKERILVPLAVLLDDLINKSDRVPPEAHIVQTDDFTVLCEIGSAERSVTRFLQSVLRMDMLGENRPSQLLNIGLARTARASIGYALAKVSAKQSGVAGYEEYQQHVLRRFAEDGRSPPVDALAGGDEAADQFGKIALWLHEFGASGQQMPWERVRDVPFLVNSFGVGARGSATVKFSDRR